MKTDVCDRWYENKMCIELGTTKSDLIKNDEFTGDTCRMIIISKN